jgi:cardiolipin synthase
VVASVGSTNLDWRSFVHNFEYDVIALDAAFGAQMERLFRRDMDAAQEIAPQTWDARPADERVREWVARRFAYLL